MGDEFHINSIKAGNAAIGGRNTEISGAGTVNNYPAQVTDKLQAQLGSLQDLLASAGMTTAAQQAAELARPEAAAESTWTERIRKLMNTIQAAAPPVAAITEIVNNILGMTGHLAR